MKTHALDLPAPGCHCRFRPEGTTAIASIGQRRRRCRTPGSATAYGRPAPSPCVTPLFVALHAIVTVELLDERKCSASRLRRVSEAALCRVRVVHVGSIENPERAQQWRVPMFDRPAPRSGRGRQQTGKTVTVRRTKDQAPDHDLHATASFPFER